MSTWHAIYVSSRQEKKVYAKLLEKGVEAYLPLKKTLNQWSDRKKWVYSPLISGYVFVKSSEIIKPQILQTRGVVSFVRYNNREAVIRQSEIDILKRIEEFGYEVNVFAEKIGRGDQFVVFQGPLKGLEVEVLELNDDDSVCVFVMDSIAQNFKLKLPKAMMKKANKKAD